MDGVRTRGHEVAVGAVRAMIRGAAPHAVLLVGPVGVGKTTLAIDLAAGLLCVAPGPLARPCGTCRACRLVASAGHPDLHRLGPEGPGRQVVIGGPGSRARGIRDLIGELSLMPVEGGARVAIIESAQRMNEDAQAALLKTLEEPPTGVSLILCADSEEPLLPTIRSRCARLRLGPVGVRDVEDVLAEHGVTDPPLAARLARLSGGRPGVALAWARQPDLLQRRDELARVLLDLTAKGPADRLLAIREAVLDASRLAVISGNGPAADDGRADGSSTAQVDPETSGDGEATTLGASRAPASERRRAAEALVAIWTDVTRDLVIAAHGSTSSLRDPRLLEELTQIVHATDPDRPMGGALDGSGLVAFLERLGRAEVLLAGNVAPGLVLDDLAIGWPQRPSVAA
jgi:DNA polymerase-3 subunit delta'